MFGTRIEDAAKHLGLPIEFLPPRADPRTALERLSPALVVVALDAPGWGEVVAAAKTAGAHVLAFGSHKDMETLRAAKAAGCDEVVARSRMASEVASLLDKHSRWK